jgi:hypothetical protein
VKLTDQEVRYLGVLANVDSTILNVSLREGFRIERMPYNDLVDLLSALTRSPPWAIASDYLSHYRHIFSAQLSSEFKAASELQCYVVSSSFTTELEFDQCGRLIGPFTSQLSAFAQTVQNYLDRAIRLMRLDKEGNISKPLECYFTLVDGEPRQVMRKSSPSQAAVEELFTVEDGEIRELEEFIHRASLPAAGSYADIAFQNFELSYQVCEISLSFLSLATALEVLLGSGAHRAARNAAVLLGTDEKDSMAVFEEVKDLHDKRSQLVHSGKPSKVHKEDVRRLRFYVREAIKRVSRLGIPKNKLLQQLNTMGFGDGVNLQQRPSKK